VRREKEHLYDGRFPGSAVRPIDAGSVKVKTLCWLEGVA
jgi:hypothetical protein